MSSENQDSKVLLQKRLIRFLEDESRMSTLSKLLDIVENGTFDSASSNIENFYSSYNDLTSKKQEIDEILDDIKDCQEQINNAYNEIYDINDSNIELKDSSSILNNLRQANDNASKIIETYIKFYGQEDVNGVPTQGIISKLKSACEEIEESIDKINELKDIYKEVFEGAGDGENIKDDEKALVDFLADKRKE